MASGDEVSDALLGNRFRSTQQFARLIGLAAILDAVDRGRDLDFEADAFRAPVTLLGTDLPTPTFAPAVAAALGLVWLLGGLLLALGSPNWQRIGAIAVLIGSGTALAIDQQLYSNHTWLLWSLALLIAIGRHAIVELTARSQISIVYAFAALSKFRSPWLDGDILRRSADGVLGLTVARDLSEPGLAALAGATIVVELVLAVIIWNERLRPIAVVLALSLHLGIVAVVGAELGLVVFALAMLAHFLLPPPAWSRSVSAPSASAPSASAPSASAPSASTRNS